MANKEKAGNSSFELVVEDDRTPDTFPLGVLRAWLTLTGAFMLQMCTIGAISAFGVFQEFYTTSWLNNHSASDVSWIGSVELFLGLGWGLIGGKFYDAGYGRPTIIFGSILFSFSFFMLSLSKERQFYQPFLSQGLGMGCGLCFVFVPTCTLVSHHFKSRKALAMARSHFIIKGILVAAGPLGGIIFSVMLNQLIHSNVGYQWGVRASASVASGCLLIGNVLLSIPPSARSSAAKSNKKEDQRLLQWPYLLTLLTGFMVQLGAYFPIFYIQLFAKKHDIPEELRFYSLAILNAASIFGRTIPNYFADKYGAINVYILSTALNGLVGFSLMGAGSIVGLTLFCIFDGFFFGASIALYLPVIASLAPREADMGKTLGLAMAPVGLSALVGTPIAGAVLGSSLVWWKGITFASVGYCYNIPFQSE
ncbi:MFS general substrate transporter [Cyathus striatus]|nr:MFS general substrate transporter [Cyathus striatus]